MKRSIFILTALSIILVVATACTLQARSPATPTSGTVSGEVNTTPGQGQPTATSQQTGGTGGQAQAGKTIFPTPTIIPPTLTPPPPGGKPTRTATKPPKATPTKTPLGPIFDPYQALGEPDWVDPMDRSSFFNWAPPETRTLPDNSSIRVRIAENKLTVTGKKPGFSTWWFSWPSLSDFYLEGTFDTLNCGEEDAYGLILRGPEHLAGESHGYIVAFTCNGGFYVSRLDSANPFSAFELIPLTKTDLIKSGSDEVNKIGVRLEGDTLTVYANGYVVGEVSDDFYSEGRYGLFVRSDQAGAYTYRPIQLVYWELKD